MGTIHVNFNEVYEETARLRNHLTSAVGGGLDAEYRRMRSQLDRVDGAVRAGLQEAMEANRQKAAMAVEIVDRLLQFISGSARQIEIQDRQMGRAFASARR